MKICHRNDPNLNDCIKKSVEVIRPYLKTGIPELLVPPSEPLKVPEFELTQAAGAISMKSTFNNIQVLGTTDFVLKSVK